MSRPPVAFVVQRYGASVTGGSEALARAVAERLSPFHEVTVFTTCARDYVTWRNELPAGDSEESGVRVLRFPVAEERDLAAFNAFAEPLYARETTREEELQFLRRQGPVVPALVEALAAEDNMMHVKKGKKTCANLPTDAVANATLLDRPSKKPAYLEIILKTKKISNPSQTIQR